MLAVRVFVVALTLALASAQADILALHNGYRRAHQVPPLTSSAALTSAAQSWANRLAASCTFEHARGTGQGENLASGHRSWTEVARGWYNEVRQYNYGAPGFGMSTGHFTQMSFDQRDKTAAMLAVRVFVVALTLALASAQADILALHNGYRRAHQVPPLTSSAALTSAAQSWANRLAASCTFEHARGTGQGENLASGHRSWTEVARGCGGLSLLSGLNSHLSLFERGADDFGSLGGHGDIGPFNISTEGWPPEMSFNQVKGAVSAWMTGPWAIMVVMQDAEDERRVNLNTFGANYMTQEVDFRLIEVTFLELGVKLMFTEAFEYKLKVFGVIGGGLGINKNIIQVHNDEVVDVIGEDAVHLGLEGSGSISKTKAQY
ncbi:hypothetical protein QJQ45_028692 [Haematococcus lacustris]|nr:hypothetical protein QJQ45_028692 [Haematococcus lacustris]